MPDDLDDLLRRTMKTLDDQVPSGYFEALPDKTLARLEESSMPTTGTSDRERRTSAPPPVSVKVPSIIPPPRVASPSSPPPIADVTRVDAPKIEPMKVEAPKVEAPKIEAKKPDPAAPDKPASTEDSGLHDIRSLAQSTKQRLSHKRVTQNPPMNEDVLAASSAGFKAVALPEPAKMVSLPALDELPSKKEVIAKDKAAKQARADKAEKAVLAAAAPLAAIAPTAVPVEPPSAAAVHTSERFAAFANRRASKSKAPIVIVGTLVAAAAGVAIYFGVQNSSSKKSAPAATASDTTVAQAQPAPAPTPAPVQAPAAGSAANAEPPPVEANVEANKDQQAADSVAAAAPAEIAQTDEPKAAPSKSGGKHVTTAKTKPTGKVEAKQAEKPEEKAPPPPPTDKKNDGKKTKGSGEGDPSFDALLKEAGVDETKKPPKPKLERKQLSGDEFKKGMASVQAKAQSCFKGTQGTAQLKMNVAPSGQVTSVTISGQFAGKPEGACVEAAVRSASFPAWDGSPQSFGYSYLLAE